MSKLTRRVAIKAKIVGVSYDTDAQAYFTAMSTQPNSTRKGLINTLILDLKSAGVWSKLDWLCLFASHDSQSGLLNAKNPSKTFSAVNSPTFTADRGFTGDASTSYLQSGENYNAAGSAFSLNDMHAGAYINAEGAASGVRPLLGQSGSGTRVAISSQKGSTTGGTTRIADNVSSSYTQPDSTRKGHRVITRRDSSNKHIFINGSNKQSFAVASTGTGTAMWVLLSTTTYTDDQVAAFHSGIQLSDSEIAALHTALHTYMTAIGANY